MVGARATSICIASREVLQWYSSIQKGKGEALTKKRLLNSRRIRVVSRGVITFDINGRSPWLREEERKRSRIAERGRKPLAFV